MFTCSLGDFFQHRLLLKFVDNDHCLRRLADVTVGRLRLGLYTESAACTQQQQPVYRSSSLYTESAAFPRVPNVLKAVRDLKPEGTEF